MVQGPLLRPKRVPQFRKPNPGALGTLEEKNIDVIMGAKGLLPNSALSKSSSNHFQSALSLLKTGEDPSRSLGFVLRRSNVVQIDRIKMWMWADVSHKGVRSMEVRGAQLLHSLGD